MPRTHRGDPDSSPGRSPEPLFHPMAPSAHPFPGSAASMPTARALQKIDHRMGMHARPAMGFVDLAGRFESEVRVGHADYAGGPVDGKSIMHLMMLAATDGTELEISAEGSDAAGAVERLCRYVRDGFEESPTPIAAPAPVAADAARAAAE